MAIQPDIRSGLNLSMLDELTEEEHNPHLLSALRNRGPLYQLWCNEITSDYAYPDWLKLHGRAVRHCDAGGHMDYSQPDYLILSVHNLPSYMVIGWVTGIRNESSSYLSVQILDM